MKDGELGKVYKKGDVVVRQGETGDCMYIIQEGKFEVFREKDGQEFQLSVLTEGDVFGEMALIEREVRSATVRALEEGRALTVDKNIFLRRVHEDPSLALRILQKMSHRVRELSAELVRIKTGL